MRRIVIWAMSTLTVLVLLFSHGTSRSSTPVATAETRQAASTAPTAPTADQQTTTSSGSSTSSSGSSTSASTTYDGDAVGTRYGDVQVRIIVEDGRITAVDVLQVPSTDRHDQMINSQAVPVYDSEAVQAQSAQIDVVSGATVTWEGYTQSLQSAIDKANL
jgi:uncharacterized protein with FMN-binding domain